MPDRTATALQKTPPVRVRASNGALYEVQADDKLSEASDYIKGLLRDRKQWRNVEAAREGIVDYCIEYMKQMGLSGQEELSRLGRAGLVEVEIDMNSGPVARELAWEFVISEATRRYRTVRAPLVIRRLIRAQAGAAGQYRPNANPVMFVRSAPAGLDHYYSFDSELKLLQSTLQEGVQILDPIYDPTESELSSAIAATSPGLIHFAGFDGLQGAALLQKPKEEWQPGMFFRGNESLDGVVAPPARLAAAACCGPLKPALVSYNIYNSIEIAAQTVQAGARASIGFQDEVDDSLAELFYASFYCGWQESGWSLIEAYQRAWQAMASETATLRGTGITLWTADSLVTLTTAGPSSKPTTTTTSPPKWLNPDDIADVRDAIGVEVSPWKKLNYSMLHNNRPLFERFEIKRLMRGILSDVCVQVVLHAGNESSEYTANFTLTDKEPIIDVKKMARVSLTSEIVRSLRESVYTSLNVCVSWKHRIVRQETFRVALLPTDEWQDDDLNRIWLPSFVLPRDPAVPRIVDTAQRYLVALADAAGTGFDGYQGVQVSGPEQERCRSVDLQAAAIWWALVYDYSLGYVNPPPTFTSAAQRLRVPSDVIEGRRGTCIDLTLLIAALFEYVDIHPVVFLLAGHAFPAYCRSSEAHQALRKLFYNIPAASSPTAPEAERSGIQREWILDSRYYGAIVKLVQSGQLVPIESVALTQRSGFWDAVAQGAENLRNKTDFQYLIDVKLAREADVTPIPVWSVKA